MATTLELQGWNDLVSEGPWQVTHRRVAKVVDMAVSCRVGIVLECNSIMDSG